MLLNTAAVADESPTNGPPERRYEQRQRHMGTEFQITAYASDPQRADAAMAAAFQRIEQLDQTLSNYRSDSELSRLSAGSPQAEPTAVGQDLWQVLRAADQVSRNSDGAFDVTIGPLSKLWRRARRTGQWPDRPRWEAARAAVGYQHIEYETDTQLLRLTRPGTLLDLGGIAKGYALDQALRQMQHQGVTRVLIDGGGDILTGEPPPGQPGWRVGVAGLRPNDPIQQWLVIQNRAVATSGDLWQYFEIDGMRYSHLIDPRTGVPLTQSSSVTVIGPSGMLADAWASALSVLGPESGFVRLGQQPNLEARVARAAGDDVELRKTAGFDAYAE
jgi:thiamine biosynthesis lipoprotein